MLIFNILDLFHNFFVQIKRTVFNVYPRLCEHIRICAKSDRYR